MQSALSIQGKKKKYESLMKLFICFSFCFFFPVSQAEKQCNPSNEKQQRLDVDVS